MNKVYVVVDQDGAVAAFEDQETAEEFCAIVEEETGEIAEAFPIERVPFYRDDAVQAFADLQDRFTG